MHPFPAIEKDEQGELPVESNNIYTWVTLKKALYIENVIEHSICVSTTQFWKGDQDLTYIHSTWNQKAIKELHSPVHMEKASSSLKMGCYTKPAIYSHLWKDRRKIEGKEIFPVPGAGASWQAEIPAVLTSEAVEASSWLGYSATVPATVDKEQEKLG